MNDFKDPPPPIIQDIELRPLQSRGQLTTIDAPVAKPEARSFAGGHGLFLITFVAPVLFAATYLALIASDRYVSEAQFIVRAASSSGYESAASLVQNQGLSRATDETFAVMEYITSRDALELLVARNRLREIFARPEADFINAFPNFYTRDNKERLYRHYQQMVRAYIDGSTGITTIEVTAFRPDDAKTVAIALLRYAEEFINRLNERAHKDAAAYADLILQASTEDIAKIERRMTEFRNKSGMIDPSSESLSAMEIIGQMSTDLSKLEANLQQQLILTPTSPSIPAMREQVKSYRNEIFRLRTRIAGADTSMASQLGAYEQLALERTIAVRALESAVQNKTRARQEAEQQHLYLQTIVQPNLSDHPRYPRRLLYFIATVAISLLVYATIRSLSEIAAEHSI